MSIPQNIVVDLNNVMIGKCNNEFFFMMIEEHNEVDEIATFRDQLCVCI